MARIGVNKAQWLVLGSFPLQNRQSGRMLESGYDIEAQFVPAAGEKFDGHTWTPYGGLADAGSRGPAVVDFLDPSLPFDDRQWCYAYAATYVYAPKAMKALMVLGSDDGVLMYANGLLVHRNDCQRAFTADTDEVPLALRAGWNTLLFKVSQAELAWMLSARLCTRDKKPLNLAFSSQRPAGPMFKGFSARRNGVCLARSPRVEIFTDAHGLRVGMGLTVFNDSGQDLSRVVAQVIDAEKKVLAEAVVSRVKAFSTRPVVIDAPGQQLLSTLSDQRGAHILVKCSLNEFVAPIETVAVGVLFFGAMSGFVTPLTGQAEFAVPSVFHGQPAVLEVEPGDGLLPDRTVGQPKWPSRQVSAEETQGGTVRVNLEAPPGMVQPRARLTFGDKGTQVLVGRVRFLVQKLEADLSATAESARKGLAALVRGDFAAACLALKSFEEALSSTQPNRRDELVTLVGHAHIDMNWLWTSAETVQVCHDTFRQALSFMEEFPQFTFSQSQSACYRMIERTDPKMFEQIRHRIAQGRWELLGGAVTEGDTNMSSGEGIARTLLYGQRYFLARFGKMARVGWLPDNFGHVGQLPQLLNLAGMRYFYAHRCQPQLGAYVWEGVEGSTVIHYVTPNYNGEVTPDLRLLPRQYDPKHGRLMWIYGVGDHGGGPTRRDVTAALAYDQLPEFPRLQFGTAEAFFKSLETDRAALPVHRGELGFAFEGCYTSIARIKEGNRRCESALYSAEMLATLMTLHGQAYPSGPLSEAWEQVAFNQFHDILCGSATHESNRESVGTYDLAMQKAQEVQYGALRGLAALVPSAADQGQPLVVFNTLPRKRSDVVEAEIFSHIAPPAALVRTWGYGSPHPTPAAWVNPIMPVDVGQGPYATVRLRNAAGRAVDAQMVDGKLFPNGYRLKVRFLAQDMPACGHQLYYVRPDLPGKVQDGSLTVKGTTIETPYLRVEVDGKTGHVSRIFDRKRKQEVLGRGRMGNVLRAYMEKPHAMSAWSLGPISSVQTIDQVDSVRVVERGPVRAVIEVWRRWGRSTFVQRIIVHRDLPRVDFELDARWFEIGGPNHDAPMLRVGFGLNVKKGKFVCDTPYAAMERPTNGQEVPVQQWADLSGRGGGAALMNETKYGHRCTGDEVEMTLLRSGYDPDPYPDQGPHMIRYSLLPHGGDWKAAGVAQAAREYNLPALALETSPTQTQPGAAAPQLEAGTGLMSLAPDNFILSALKKAEDGDEFIVRFHEAHGVASRAVLTLPLVLKSAVRVDLLEMDLPGAAVATIQNNTVSLDVKAREVVTLKLAF